MTARPRLRVAAAIATAGLGGIAVAGTADAGNGFATDDFFYGFFYDDPGAGLVVSAGAPIEDFCLQEDPGVAELRIFDRVDGTEDLKAHGQRDQRLYVYAFDGIAPELIDQTCEALSDPDPETGAPVPLATGRGVLKFDVEGIEGPDDLGGFSISNSINGMATSEDGTTWKVRAWADFDVDEDGFEIGSPEDFQGLHVTEIRRNR